MPENIYWCRGKGRPISTTPVHGGASGVILCFGVLHNGLDLGEVSHLASQVWLHFEHSGQDLFPRIGLRISIGAELFYPLDGVYG